MILTEIMNVQMDDREMPEIDDTGDLEPWSGCDDSDDEDEDSELDEDDNNFHRCAAYDRFRSDHFHEDVEHEEEDEDESEEEEEDESGDEEQEEAYLSAHGRPSWSSVNAK